MDEIFEQAKKPSYQPKRNTPKGVDLLARIVGKMLEPIRDCWNHFVTVWVVDNSTSHVEEVVWS